jgi:gamma-butyrobetaine dioxygenase
MTPVEELAAFFAGDGGRAYLGEAVTLAAHMLQAGALAQASRASDALVAAALLHDVGHFRGPLRGEDLMSGTDNRHEESGARFLARRFGPEVSEPVRLHVPAKRYLCLVEPEYLSALSEASRYTLGVQGGPMTAPQAVAFEKERFLADAIRLRRWDDQAKDASVEPPPFEHFVGLLEALVTPGS